MMLDIRNAICGFRIIGHNFTFASGRTWERILGMAKTPKSDDVKDEPGAETRFLRGIRKALKTPPTKHSAKQQKRHPKEKTK